MTASPRLTARLAGLLYLLIMLAAAFGEVAVRGGLIVRDDAQATARNVLAHEQLFRLGGGADLVTFACDIALAALFYVLLKPAGKTTALVAAFFRLAYAAIIGVVSLAHFAPLIILHGKALGGFTEPQLDALAYFSLKLHNTGFNIALVFFGVHLVLLGWLVAKSRYLPVLIGVLLAIAGVCYVINSVLNLIFPTLSLAPYILLPALLGEGGLTLWLLLVGLNPLRWQERTTSA
jgi:hypothetical protein